MTVFVTRHGQSMTNIDADLKSVFKINNHNNVLTPTGIEQARAYGVSIKDRGIQHIVASPYSRTMQTAFCIASELGSCVPISFEHDIREIGWEVHGEWHRQEIANPRFNYKKVDVDFKPFVDHKRGAQTLESQREVYNRVIPAFENIVSSNIGQNVLIVTHYFVVRAIQSYMEHGDADHMNNYNPSNLIALEYDI